MSSAGTPLACRYRYRDAGGPHRHLTWVAGTVAVAVRCGQQGAWRLPLWLGLPGRASGRPGGVVAVGASRCRP